MSTLIVYLPPGPASAATEYGYVLSHDGLGVAAFGSASASLLPPVNGEVVAVVGVQALSWHEVALPKGSIGARGASATPRLRAILEGLLEERLLDDPQDLHFALAPDARPQSPVWVAVCERAWLGAALQNLERAGRPVARVVPEFAPDGSGQAPVWQVLGTQEHAQLVCAGAQGVTVLPLDAGSVALARLCGAPGAAAESAPALRAEPAVAALAEHGFKRPAQLQQSAQRWLQAAQSGWDLAQFDLVSSSRARTFKRLTQAWQSLRHAPQWRALRWGAGLLVAVQLLGLNLWAWHEKSALQAQRTAINAVLTQTFPGVRVVLDASAQMERELAALRQATGTTSGADLEAMLGATSGAVPANRSPFALEFAAGEARLKGLNLSPDEAASVGARLKGQGYTARTEADALVLQLEARP